MKRILAFILCLAMICGCAASFADEVLAPSVKIQRQIAEQVLIGRQPCLAVTPGGTKRDGKAAADITLKVRREVDTARLTLLYHLLDGFVEFFSFHSSIPQFSSRSSSQSSS